MRRAALYDIHGNLPALEAVLRDVRHEGVEELILGGDVFPGPMAPEVLDALLGLELPVHFLRGNGDRAILELATGGDTSALPEAQRPAIQWAAERLSAEHKQVLASWPPSLQIDSQSLGRILFCHATPQSDTDIFTRRTAQNRLLEIFQGVEADLVVCGHTHMQYDLSIGGLQVVNAGSVGMAFGEPGAYWVLLGDEVELRRTDYDREAAATRIRASDNPGAEAFAQRNVLDPPTEEEMLALFTPAEPT